MVALAFSVSSNVYISVLFVQTDEAVLAKAVCFHYFQFHIGNSDTQQSTQRSKKKKRRKSDWNHKKAECKIRTWNNVNCKIMSLCQSNKKRQKWDENSCIVKWTTQKYDFSLAKKKKIIHLHRTLSNSSPTAIFNKKLILANCMIFKEEKRN